MWAVLAQFGGPVMVTTRLVVPSTNCGWVGGERENERTIGMIYCVYVHVYV